jgi:hypothetical protein
MLHGHHMLEPRVVRRRYLPTTHMLAAGIVAALLAPLPIRGQSYGLSDLPPDAKPADLSVYLEASVAGTLFHVCRSTDVKGRFGWYLRASEASLLDAQKNEIGKARFTYSGLPRVRVEAAWEDIKGGTVVAKATTRGPLPGKPELQWQRYDVEMRSGEGRLTEAKAIIRIAAWKTIPYRERCDKARAGTEVRSSFTATDLFFK